MLLPTTILVPTDFSTCAEHAVQYGQQLAKRLGARIFLLHSWNMPYSRWDEVEDTPQHVPTKLEQLARNKLDARVNSMRSDVPQAEGLFYVGEASASILKAVADVKAELIVVGTHGRRGLMRMIEGSVTEYVTRRAPCPVLAIRQPDDPA